MTTFFHLWHEYERPDGEAEEKQIGVFSSREIAQQAIERLKEKPGFKDYPDGFNIYEIELDKVGWEEGFVTADPSDPYSEEFDYDEKGNLVRRKPSP